MTSHPQDVHVLIYVICVICEYITTLHGKSKFVAVIKLNILRWEDHRELSGGLSTITGALHGRRQEDKSKVNKLLLVVVR